MLKTLIISDVDLELLEEQRCCLESLLDRSWSFSEEEKDCFRGLLNMLNHWSDERFFDDQRQHCPCLLPSSRREYKCSVDKHRNALI